MAQIIRFNFSLQDFQQCYNHFIICLTYNNIRYLKYTFKNNFQCKLALTMILLFSVFFRTYIPHVAVTDLEGLSFFVPAHVYFSQQIKSINNWQPCSTAFLLISLFFSVSDELVCVRMCVWVCVCVCFCVCLEPFRNIWLRASGGKASQKLSTQSFAYCSYIFSIAACLHFWPCVCWFFLARCLLMLMKREKRDHGDGEEGIFQL